MIPGLTHSKRFRYYLRTGFSPERSHTVSSHPSFLATSDAVAYSETSVSARAELPDSVSIPSSAVPTAAAAPVTEYLLFVAVVDVSA